jgi:hypothetical protein
VKNVPPDVWAAFLFSAASEASVERGVFGHRGGRGGSPALGPIPAYTHRVFYPAIFGAEGSENLNRRESDK